jgi:hypothetical protein
VEIETVGRCYFLTNNHTCDSVNDITDVIGNFLSVPTIGVLMRFSPLISLID